MKPTKAGYELMKKIGPHFKDGQWSWFEIEGILSAIHRHAVTLHHVNENLCNGLDFTYNQYKTFTSQYLNKLQDKFMTRNEKKSDQLEKRIEILVAMLPPLENDKRVAVKFGSDPRGATVTLLTFGCGYDNWERDGYYVH